MSSNSDQCALAADGTLLDADRILFYNDPDDDIPLPSVPTGSNNSDSDLFPVVSSRRSGRKTRPSARVLDPNNLEALVTRKRSATMTVSKDDSMRAARRAKVSDMGDEVEDEQDGDDLDDEAVHQEVQESMGDEESETPDSISTDNEEAAEEAYAATKAMGDNDRRVSLSVYHYVSDKLLT
jgi:hypothetical protein